MKKRLMITISTVLLCCLHGFAQNGEFIHITYPNEWIIHTGWADTYYDINNDSIPDIVMHHQAGYAGVLEGRFHVLDNWDCCSYSTYTYVGYNNYYVDLSEPLDSENITWGYNLLPEERIGVDTFSYKTSLRYYDRENYYYGWLRAFMTRDDSANTVSFIVTETYFCTIPNYPLKWGQTSLNTNVDENASSAFAAVYPNPSTGFVSVIGKSLRQAEVFNTFGQRVATITGEGETLQVDISGLPAGVYFVNVTDKDGRKCVRKVVKE